MPWIRLDDGFAEHPKLLAVGAVGLAVHVRAMCYCARQLTDGFIPSNAVTFMLFDVDQPEKIVESLLAAGLWTKRSGNPGGYEINDYLDYNPSRKQVYEARKSNAYRQMKHRQRSKATPEDPGASPAQRNAENNALVTESPSPSPSPVKRSPPTPRNLKRPDPKFESFWKAYPRKVGKPVARKAFEKVNPDDALMEVILSALSRQRRWPTWTKDYGQYIPHPSTWLNQERWNDQPPELDIDEVTYED